ncbi:maleylacetoacetate isomerase [Marinomonas sp. SBI22]|uniref:maleylacetoacetate isomerase n=1 Tax=unclassified Marinomonas TaxID=196814 RepID=UPI0007AF381E|nr:MULTISPECIES: maleylacetoacetate isomerase [unclassified Marinomonas]KZM44391.1 maleylacetoacetate isomerase [Marinomonas sp. SBI22]KZM45549.1 maleylacetoacetate isomerase [Marinomonas sp. SBI8L]
MLTLYGYWRSSAAYRVRIALNLKGLEYHSESVHLVKDGGQQHSESYQSLNPSELVPTLVDGEFVLNQSMAILQYLDDVYPQYSLLPEDKIQKAKILAFASDIACEMHPINNLRVLQHLKSSLGHTQEETENWYRHWLKIGFDTLETRLASHGGKYCFADQISMADLVLVPQVYNAIRYQLDMKAYPKILDVYENCLSLEAFFKAAPEQQEDAN